MGVAQNSLLGAGAAIGVTANKFAVGIGSLKDSKEETDKPVISQAVDADKAERAAVIAKYQKEKLKNMKLRNKKLRMQNKALKEKQILKKEEKPNEQK